MDLGTREVAQTRQSRRTRSKSNKAIEWESTTCDVAAAWDSDEDVIEVEPSTLGAPRPKRTRGRPQSTSDIATATARASGSQANDESNALATILTAIEDIRASNGVLHAAFDGFRASDTELKASNELL